MENIRIQNRFSTSNLWSLWKFVVSYFSIRSIGISNLYSSIRLVNFGEEENHRTAENRRGFIASLIFAGAVALWPYYSFDFQYAILLGAICLFLAYLIARKLGYLIGTGYLYFAWSSIPRMVYPKELYGQFDISAIVGLDSLVHKAFVYVTCITLFFAYFKPSLRSFFVTLGFVNAAVMIGKYLAGKDPYFLLNNSGTDSGFIACILPFVLPHPISVIFILPLILGKTSTGILGLGAGVAGYVFIKHRKWIWTMIPLAGLLSAIGFYMQGKFLIDSSGRVHIWTLAWDYWKNFINHWFGVGAGTSFLLVMSLQMVEAATQKLEGFAGFPWLHNSWYQTMWETGYIGLAFFLAIYLRALFQARNRPGLFGALTAAGFVSIIQMTMNWMIFTMLIAWMVREARGKQWS